MDAKLVAWGRSVKSRNRLRRSALPPLWLFTDPVVMPDVVAVVAGLPRGLCGVVFRHDGVAGRAALAAQVALMCRQRRLALVMAGDPGLAWRLRAGVHLRGGRGPAPRGLATASAHGAAELVRARRQPVSVSFLSPVFPTSSHPGARPLGLLRFAALARHGGAVAALGGIDGRTVRRLPWRRCRAVGAITALVA